ncbi:G/U mismatch-specific DNA glycosylase [Nafulsella turpanensis]|uniref:G/U mismatch-specific DNA glycosylase n=1 Tax=Nafulsella turpanensis TaxID=1265690 RepID=UPI00034A3BEE|nr:G/U mismatch-specific DNA glycosylase [Nafulsella turpanensis]
MATYFKPSVEQIEAAEGKTVPDIIAPGLQVLFCGINPGLYSGATGHHFARPGNRFWPALHASGFTAELLHPSQEELLLKEGVGITNFVERASRAAAELRREELIEGGKRLEEKVRKFKPSVLAVLGITAYRAAFKKPKAVLGLQEEGLAGTAVYVLPNPSGLNAHFTPKQLAVEFRKLLLFAFEEGGQGTFGI